MDTENHTGTSDTPPSDWRQRLAQAAIILRIRGMCDHRDWLILYAVTCGVFWIFAPGAFFTLLLVSVLGLALLFHGAQLEHRRIRDLLNGSNVIQLLVEQRLDIDDIFHYVPPQLIEASRGFSTWRDFVIDRRRAELADWLVMLAVNFDWYLKSPRPLFRAVYLLVPGGIVLTIALAIFCQFTPSDPMMSTARIFGFRNPWVILAYTAFFAGVLLPYCLHRARLVVWGKALIKGLSYELGINLLVDQGTLGIGVTDLLNRVRSRISYVVTIRRILLVLSTLLAVIAAGFVQVLGAFPPVFILIAFVAIFGAILISSLRRRHYETMLHAGLAQTSIALKLIGNEFTSEVFDPTVRLQAGLWGAYHDQPGFIRDALLVSFSLKRYIRLPSPSNVLMAAIAAGLLLAIIGSEVASNFQGKVTHQVSIFGPTIIGWCYLVLFDYVNITTTRLLTVLNHLRDQLME